MPPGNKPLTQPKLTQIYVTIWCHNELTHWGRVTHICVGKLTIIGPDNGLSPGRHQAIIWTNPGMVLFGPLGTERSEISVEIHTFSSKKMHLKMSSGKWRPICLVQSALFPIRKRPHGQFLQMNSFSISTILKGIQFYTTEHGCFGPLPRLSDSQVLSCVPPLTPTANHQYISGQYVFYHEYESYVSFV